MEFCAEDECVEVTPEIVRVRKVELDATTAGPGPLARQGPRQQLSRRAGWPSLLGGCRYPEQRAEARTRHCRDIRADDVDLGLHRQPAAGAAEHRHHGDDAPPPPKATQIIMAIDSIGPGFNPHLLSDQSPVNAAISSLVLPSSFRPVPDPNTPTGSRWELDTTLLESAEVTSENPFTVTYKIRPEASWTDNAPIGADDFWYLWRQMVSQPGVVDPAGLRPHHRRAVGGGRQDGGGDLLAAVSGVARAVQRHPARPHRQGRARRFRRGPGARAAGHRRSVPGGEHRPSARRDPAGPQRPLLERARQTRPGPVPPRRRRGRAGRLDPQRRHPGRPGARRRGRLRATVGDPRCADGADRHPPRHAVVAAGPTARARGFPSAQGDLRPARRRPARRGRRRRRQHGDAGAGAGAIAVGSGLRADRAAGDLERGRARAARSTPATRSSPSRRRRRRHPARPLRTTIAAASPRTACR